MSLALQILLPFIVLFLFNCTTTLLLKQKFGKVLPISFMLIMIIQYFGQFIFGTFNIGFILIIIYSLLSILLLAIKKFDKKYINNIFTVGFFAFTFLYILFTILYFNKHFNDYDEVMHWGKMVKEMLRLDKFYTEEASTLIIHKDYPPFISLFELTWCKIINQYSEMGVTIALHVLIGGFVITPLVEILEVNKKNIIKAILIGGIILITILSVDAYHIFSSIYLDYLLSAIFAYSMYLIFVEEENKYFYIGLALSCVTIIMTKQVGIAFLGIALFTYVIKNIVINFKDNKNKKELLKKIIFIVVVLLIVFAIHKIWSIYVAGHNVEQQFKLSDIKIFEFNKALKDEDLKLVLKKFIKAGPRTKLTSGMIKITYLSSYLFIIILMIGSWKMLKKYLTDNNKKELIILAISFALGTIGYWIMMLLIYLYSMSIEEALSLASYDRYMGTYFLGELLVTVILIIFYILKNKIKLSNSNILVLLLILIVLLDGTSLQDLIPQVALGDTYYNNKEYAKDIEKTTDEGTRILVISEKKVHNQVYTHYYVEKRYFEKTTFDFLNIDINDGNSVNEAKEIIKKQDYIYLVQTSDNFNNCFKQYLKDGEQFEELKTYKVNIIDDTFELVKQ